MADAADLPLDATPLLDRLLRGHGCVGRPTPDGLAFPDRRLRASAALAPRSALPGAHPLVHRLDVWFDYGLGANVLESFVGLGDGPEAGAADGMAAFAANSLHVLLATFFDRPADPEVTVEEWIQPGGRRRAVFGPATVRGQMPAADRRLPRLADRCREFLRAARFDDGLHWVRVYYAQLDRQPTAVEVLRDNQPWPEAAEAIAGFGWPAAAEFYGARLFLTVRGGADLPAALATAYRLRDRPDAEVAAALTADGLSRLDAEKFTALVPLAFGRVLLDGLGIGFADTGLVRDGRTNAERTVRLADEPIFRWATAAAEAARQTGRMTADEFQAFALRGAEFHAINRLLHDGSQPHDLVLSPTVFFWGEYEPA